jgi:uncharacterized alkaline shock family protein YloU
MAQQPKEEVEVDELLGFFGKQGGLNAKMKLVISFCEDVDKIQKILSLYENTPGVQKAISRIEGLKISALDVFVQDVISQEVNSKSEEPDKK